MTLIGLVELSHHIKRLSFVLSRKLKDGFLNLVNINESSRDNLYAVEDSLDPAVDGEFS